ncbi:hypothetical protein [Cytobacillus sp. FSL H8-0458]|uniref:hypothetical protein n=1 Tax=Cytobacillus sp. FSL H8-0458 TaxID=2975346 RepID=UPI0030FADE46
MNVKKLLPLFLGVLMFLSITGFNTLAAEKNITCGSGGTCKARNNIERMDAGWLYFTGISSVVNQPSYNQRIVSTQ